MPLWGCRHDVGAPPDRSAADPGPAELRVEVRPSRLVAGDDPPVLIHVNNSDHTISFGLGSRLECWDGSRWRQTPGGPAPLATVLVGPGEERDRNGEFESFFEVRGFDPSFEPGQRTAHGGSLGEFVALPAGWYRVSTDVTEAARRPAESGERGCERHELVAFLEVAPH